MSTRQIVVLFCVLMLAIALAIVAGLFEQKQPNAMQALAERGDSTTVRGPFEDGSTVPVFRPVKVVGRSYLDPHERLSLYTFVYEQYPYSETPIYDTRAYEAAASNEENWWGDSLGYVYWRDQLSPVGGTTPHPYFIDGSVGRLMLMRKEAIVYGGYHKQSSQLY